MKRLIALEEAAMFVLSIVAFYGLEYSWWIFPALLLVPDLSMLGYMFGTKTGAITYNIFHHKAVAIACFVSGIIWVLPALELAGIILFAHSSMDRMLGYGLKYSDAFKSTHLGVIGKK